MSMLIIRGVNTTDELSSYGQSIANAFYEADEVFLVGLDGDVEFVKGTRHPLTPMRFLDLEDDLANLSIIIESIKKTHQEVHPESKDLTHCFIGQWLFNFPNGDTYNYKLLTARHLPKLRRSAEEFVECDFGMSARVQRTD